MSKIKQKSAIELPFFLKKIVNLFFFVWLLILNRYSVPNKNFMFFLQIKYVFFAIVNFAAISKLIRNILSSLGLFHSSLNLLKDFLKSRCTV